MEHATVESRVIYHGEKVVIFVRDLIIALASGVLLSGPIGWLTYDNGRDAGYEAGHEAGFEQGQKEGHKAGYDAGVAAAVANMSKELEEEFARRRQVFNDKLVADRTAFDEQLRVEREEHNQTLDEAVAARYGELLVAEYRRGFGEGSTQGYDEGRSFGRQECQAACPSRMDEILSHGLLWEEYAQLVRSYADDRPANETDMRSDASAIVSVALDGRLAAEQLAAQLNGEIDALAEALEANDLERVNEIIEAVAASLDFKLEAWRANYRKIVIFDNE